MKWSPNKLLWMVIIAYFLFVPLAQADDAAELAKADELFKQSDELYDQGKFREAIPLAEEAKNIKEKHLGINSLETAAAANKLGRIYFKVGLFNKAQVCYQQALAVREAKLSETDLELADIYQDLAELSIDNNDLSYQVKVLLDMALIIREGKLGKEHPITAESYLLLGRLLLRRGLYPEAGELIEKAFNIFQNDADRRPINLAQAYHGLAALYEKTGRINEAEEEYNRSLAIIKKLPGSERPEAVGIYANLAMYYEGLGQYNKAEHNYDKALSLCRRTLGEVSFYTARCYGCIGQFFENTGRFAKAELFQQKALEIYTKVFGADNLWTAQVYNDLASIFRATFRQEEAKTLLLQSLNIINNNVDMEDLAAVIYVNLSNLYVSAGQYAESEDLLLKGIKIFEDKDFANLSLMLKSNLAIIYAKTHRYDAAERLYRIVLDNSINTSGELNTNIACYYSNLASLYASTRRYAEAEKFYQKAVAIDQTISEKKYGLHAQLALFYWSRGQAEKSKELFLYVQNNHANYLLQNLIAGPMGEGLASLDVYRTLTDKILSYYIDQKDIEQAYNNVIFIKGLFWDMAQITRVGMFQDAKNASHFAELRKANEKLSKMISQKSKMKEEKLRQALERQIVELQGTANEMEHRMALERFEYLEKENTLVPDWKKCGQALKANTGLIDIYRYQRFDPKQEEMPFQEYRYAAFVVNQQGVKYFDLGPADAIDAQVVELRGLLDSEYIRQHPNYWDEENLFKQKAVELYRKVFQPYEKELAGYSLVLVSPDGQLSNVPFGILVDEQGHYLVERYAFGYEASARELIRASQKTGTGRGALLVGDPDYDLGGGKANQVAQGQVQFTPGRDFATCGVASDVGLLNFGRLEASGEAARTVGQDLKRAKTGGKVEVVTGAAATESFIKQNAPGRQYLFFATHGYFIEQPGAKHESPEGWSEIKSKRAVINPLSLCGLALAGANTTQGARESTDDGLLTGSEVVGLDLSGVQLVVLAACVTGLGEVKSGQGMMGLRYAFTLAGAQTVAASAWSVPLEETKSLMEQWAPQLMAGKAPAQELRTAQLALMESMRQKYGTTHPFFWGAFTCSGKVW